MPDGPGYLRVIGHNWEIQTTFQGQGVVKYLSRDSFKIHSVPSNFHLYAIVKFLAQFSLQCA